MMMLALLKIKLTHVECPLMVNSHIKYIQLIKMLQGGENSLEDGHTYTYIYIYIYMTP
jgi:hypothetical protein